MYISVGGWTCNTTMHAAATLGYITNKPLKPTHLLKSFAKKKHCIKIVYARMYDHNVCIGMDKFIVHKKLFLLKEKGRIQS